MLRLGAALARELGRAVEDDPRGWVIDGDLADSYGLDEVAPRLGDRYIQAGIAEQTMVSLAAGLAAAGARPWVFSFAAFLCCRAYDQIRVCISQTSLPVVLVGSHAGGCAGRNGKTHAVLNDLALISTLPGIDVWAPADCREAADLVPRILARDRPAYIRLPRDPQPDLPAHEGDVSVFGVPGQVCVLSTGQGTQWALGARQELSRRGFDLAVIHLMRLRPFPESAILEALAPAKRVVVIEDHYTVGGLADSVRRLNLNRPVRALGWPTDWAGASGDAQDIRESHGLDHHTLARACLEDLRLEPYPSLSAEGS